MNTLTDTPVSPFHSVIAWLRLEQWLPGLILAVSLSATYLLWKNEQHSADQKLQTEFNSHVRETNTRIEQRMLAYRQVLRGLGGLFSHDNNVTRQQFHNYFDRLNLENNYPGILGLAFLRIVPFAQKNQYIATMRKQGYPDYAIKPEGMREIYTPVTYIEPFSGRNLVALGHDPYSDPVRRTAMEKARDTDHAVISGKVRLLQEAAQDVQAGFMMYLPIYKYDAPHNTLAERRANLIGWVSAPFRMGDLMTGLLSSEFSFIDLEIYDGEEVSTRTLMYDSDHDFGNSSGARFQSINRLPIADHFWSVSIRSDPDFEARMGDNHPQIIIYTGISASLLLTWLTWLLLSSRGRALKAAREMNRELIESKTRYQQMFDDAASITFLIDTDNGRIVDANAAAAAFWGYSQEELRGMHISRINTASREEIDAAMVQFRDKLTHHMEWHHQLKNGEVRNVEVYSGPLVTQGRTLLYSVLHDITERKRLEAKLLESESKYRVVFEKASDGIFLTDANGVFFDCNEMAASLHGRRREEIIGLSPADISDKTQPNGKLSMELMRDKNARALAGEPQHFQWRHQRADGISVDVDITLNRFYHGGAPCLIAVVRDITELKRTEQKLQLAASVFTHAREGIAITDSAGTILDVNETFSSITGFSHDEAIGHNPRILSSGRQGKAFYVAMWRELIEKGSWSGEIWNRHKNGDIYAEMLTISAVRDAYGNTQQYVALFSDTTERRTREDSLRLAATVFETVDQAVVITDTENKIITVNPAFTSITGYTKDEVAGKNPHLLSSGKHPPEFYQELWGTLTSTGSWHGEVWNRRKLGDIYVEQLSIHMVRDEEGQLTHHVGTFSDISERKAAEEHVQHMAHYDLLTDLPNRALITDRLRQTLIKAKRNKERMALMFLDLDKFKPVNDTLGHAIGDLLLKESAKRLLHCVRESDTVARIGGDEFVVLLPVIEGEQDAMVVAEKIQHALSNPFELTGHTISISVSIGIAIYPDHGDDEKTLIKNADFAMYHAKRSGRSNVKIYQPHILENE